MHWDKKICFRLTTRRIVGAILTATTMVNLVIVGTAFEAAPSAFTPTLTPFVSPTQLQGAASKVPASITSVSSTSTSIPTSTVSPTSTDTPTDLPTLALCVLRSDWPIYYLQPGDTLSTLARATGSTADELMLANCLSNQDIRPGQSLYVPRLPIKTLSPTPNSPSTDTPPPPTIVTPATVTGTPPTPAYTPPTPITQGPLYYYLGTQVLP